MPCLCRSGQTASSSNSASSATVRNQREADRFLRLRIAGDNQATPAIGRIPASCERVQASPKRSPKARSMTSMTASRSSDVPSSIRTVVDERGRGHHAASLTARVGRAGVDRLRRQARAALRAAATRRQPTARPRAPRPTRAPRPAAQRPNRSRVCGCDARRCLGRDQIEQARTWARASRASNCWTNSSPWPPRPRRRPRLPLRLRPRAARASDMPTKLAPPADGEAMRGGDRDPDSGEAARADPDQDGRLRRGRPAARRSSGRGARCGRGRSARPCARRTASPSNKAAVQAALDVSNAKSMGVNSGHMRLNAASPESDRFDGFDLRDIVADQALDPALQRHRR